MEASLSWVPIYTKGVSFKAKGEEVTKGPGQCFMKVLGHRGAVDGRRCAFRLESWIIAGLGLE
jgi:hypothetical protein